MSDIYNSKDSQFPNPMEMETDDIYGRNVNFNNEYPEVPFSLPPSPQDQDFQIDWDFIGAREGKGVNKGYIPELPDGTVRGQSGLTIATGWDVGQMSLEELQASGLPPEIINKVRPFVGLKKEEAQAKYKELGAPMLEEGESDIIDEFTHNRTVSQLSQNYNKATGKSFKDLTPGQQTAMASVGFQFGTDLENATPNFWKQTTTGDWEGAIKNLLDWESTGEASEYQARRELEAGLLGWEPA